MRKVEKKTNKKNIIFIIIYIILFCALVYSGSKIYNWYKENNNNKQIAKRISNVVTVVQNDNFEEKEKYKIDFDALEEQNDETVAWIKVNNTNVEYPIVKAENNSFYLDHSFDKSYNSAGWIFADYRNNFDGTDKNIVVYGHNRRDGSMFASLKDALSPEWYENDENMDILFDTKNENSTYKIFSIYQIEEEDYYIKTDFDDEIEFENFIDTIAKRSVKDFEVEVTGEDSILTLSTCANNNKYRVVIHAKKMQNV